MTEYAALSLAYALDLLIGDPRRIPHPVRVIGWTIGRVEHKLRALIVDADSGAPSRQQEGQHAADRQKEEKKAGIILAAIIVGFTYLIFSIMGLSRHNAGLASPGAIVSLIVFIYFVSATIATRDLIRSAQAVIRTVNEGDIGEARAKLAMIVGRDTDSLDEKGILKATIETVSENASDGIVAPMFYFALGGLPLAMAYKAVNTLDSMVGYKNDRYRHFGWAAARIDDIANYIPARITGFLIVAATFTVNAFRYFIHEGARRTQSVQKRPGQYIAKILEKLASGTEKPAFEKSSRAFEIMMRDGKKHASPNSGVPEAAMAGAVGVRLGGPSTYGGVVVRKPYIGKPPGSKDMTGFYTQAARESIFLVKVTSFMGLVLALTLIALRYAL